jgi:hypothetical protein
VWKTELETPGNIAKYGWDPAEAAGVVEKIDGFIAARAAHQADNSSPKRVAKDEAEEAARDAMRDFANSSIRYNKKMSPEERRYYGIRPRDRILTRARTPESFPTGKADTSVLRNLRIHFVDSETGKRRKPQGVMGAKIRWAILDRAPASIEELAHTEFVTASPLVLRFEEHDRGKRLYFCLCWDAATALEKDGSWSPIYSAVIP